MHPSTLQIICRLQEKAKPFDFIIKLIFFLKSEFKTKNGSKRPRDCPGIENKIINFVS